ncbi:MAG: TAXI family TRAP transporter solute-binding subunit [Gemmatimonadota bacterium]|jgi:TRAP transporter TAXI family solute receptor
MPETETRGATQRDPETSDPGPRRRSASPRRPVRTTLLALLAVAAAALPGCDGASSSSTRFLSIGTGGTGGIYYPLGGALAARLTAADSTRQYTAEVTGGSVENVKRVAAGQIDLGFTLAVTAYEAYRGGQDFAAPVEGLRVVAPLYPNMTHVLARRGLGVRGVGDLRGRTVSVGSAGSGTEQMARQLLEAAGLSYEDVEERFLSFSESAAALRDGAIDAAILSVGYPASAVLEATTTGDVVLVPVEGATLEALVKAHPYYGSGAIPPGVYPGVEEEIPTVSTLNWIVGMESLEDSVVEALLNVIADSRVNLEQAHEMARQIELDRLEVAPIPLHPATARWLGSRGG